MTSPRNLVVAVPMPVQEDPEVTLGALRWTMDQLHRPGDVIHIVHVIKCLVHKLEVFHGMPGTTFSFDDPGEAHRESEDVARAKSFLQRSVVPVLDAKQIQHRMHLSVDTIEAPASAAGQIIRDTADSVGAQLVIVGHNRQPVSKEDSHLGKVAKWALDNVKRPLVIVRTFQPTEAAHDG
ncbi:g4554 [Coccomyxa viridis]|uniref:G4554 protein n=1 Tax=Coccomyxa viridis TaxID=1274662 RepID=A0ABP1FXI9_9CHLO